VVLIAVTCLNCNEVFETFGHFAASNGEVAGMEEVSHPGVIVKEGLRLGAVRDNIGDK